MSGEHGSEVPSCEHHWVSIHQPDFPPQVYWLRQCSMCSRFDGADLAAQVERLAAALAAAREGADDTPRDPAVELTPGQLWHRLMAAPADERLELLGRAINSGAEAARCFTMNHEGRLADTEHALAAAQDEARRARLTKGVLVDVVSERARQHAKWGQQDHPDGTGPDTMFRAVPVDPDHDVTASELEDWARYRCQAADRGEEPTDTYERILTEEWAETVASPAGTEKLRTELVQVAAVAVAWAEKLDRERRAALAGEGAADQPQATRPPGACALITPGVPCDLPCWCARDRRGEGAADQPHSEAPHKHWCQQPEGHASRRCVRPLTGPYDGKDGGK